MQFICTDISLGFIAHKRLFRRLPSPLFRLSTNGKVAADNMTVIAPEAKKGEKSSVGNREVDVRATSLEEPPTVCAWCKRLRNGNGFWTSQKISIEQHPDILFTHGICPECLVKYTAEMEVLDGRAGKKRD